MLKRSKNPLPRMFTGAVMGLLCAAAPLRAGFADGISPGDSPNQVYVPDADKKVSVKEHLGGSLPMDAWFVDETGKSVQLGQFFADSRKPVLLQIGYFRCPMLCSVISRGLVDSLREIKLDAGPDYQVVFLSIDPKETAELAADKKNSFLKAYAHDGSTDGWHLLTGNKAQIDRVTEAMGIEYKWVALAQQYSHPAAVVLATPEGKISRYLYGVRFDPPTLRLSLVEASHEKIGTASDEFVLTCFQFDGRQGKYALAAIKLMKIGAGFTIVAVASGIFLLKRRGDALNS